MYPIPGVSPRNPGSGHRKDLHVSVNGKESLLETRDLTRAFGKLVAVDGVSLTIRKGELHSIIGPNGAGKTTFFKLISGEMAPSSGTIRFDNTDITGLPQHKVVRLGIAKSYQITNVFPHLTVFENVRVAAQGWRSSLNFWARATQLSHARERARAVLQEIGLGRKMSVLAAHLSHGEQRHLELAIALAGEPSLLLLDEPTAGMSPEETDETMALIPQIARGRTVVIVEHKMKLVMKVSDRITVLHQGQVLADGTPEQIRANEQVQKTYLGASR
jgi:branched-chain amino acid transport system ATP-binding protein